ncbi:hypothetical protein BDW74DRAFT_135 [Aspergillus multicolor]|uniref:HpcH/HpaI aldolase family protein n=1 Tax=Aspergillus multicolor TaxID=41759 RepID=UPI003CCD6718
MALNTALATAPQKGTTAYGFWLTLPGAGVAKTILLSTAQHANRFSWVLVNAEHGLISDKDYYKLNNAVASEGASPIVRVPWGEEWLIKRALDAGAHGILTPMCHSPEDARKIVSYCKYPPQGTRGYRLIFALHSFPEVSGAEYDTGADKNTLVFVQIKSKGGLASVEEIAAVEGLDGVLIGPFDLAKQIGVQRGGEEHEAAIFCSDGNDAQRRIAQGFNMVSITTDVGVLGSGMLRELGVASGQVEGGKPRDGY